MSPSQGLAGNSALGQCPAMVPPRTSPASVQSSLGFSVSHQVIPMPGRPDLYTVRVSTTPRTGEELLGAADVARRLGTSTRTATRLMASGLIRSHRPGLRRRRVYQRDLDAYCRERGLGG